MKANSIRTPNIPSLTQPLLVNSLTSLVPKKKPKKLVPQLLYVSISSSRIHSWQYDRIYWKAKLSSSWHSISKNTRKTTKLLHLTMPSGCWLKTLWKQQRVFIGKKRWTLFGLHCCYLSSTLCRSTMLTPSKVCSPSKPFFPLPAAYISSLGNEEDFIIISLVRSSALGFLQNLRSVFQACSHFRSDVII